MLMALASPQDPPTTETESAKAEEPCPQDAENSSSPESQEDRGQPAQEPVATTVANTITVANTPTNANVTIDGNNNNTPACVPLQPVPSTQTETPSPQPPQPPQTDPVPKPPPVGLGGVHESFATLNGGLPQTPSALSHLPANFLSSHTTIWPPRSYLPESCYTLPLPRDLCARAAQGGLTESHAPNEGEQGAGDIKPEHPMDGHHTLGGPQFFRQPHDLFRELPKMR